MTHERANTHQVDPNIAEPRLEQIVDPASPAAQVFLDLGRPYMAEVDPEHPDWHEPFLRSILRKVVDSDRWLALLMVANQPAGFASFKIDKDDRPGFGYIMEFYVVPGRRREGLGSKMLSQALELLHQAGCRDVWLSSHPTAEHFWKARGFRETGEFEREQKILAASLDDRTTKEATQ